MKKIIKIFLNIVFNILKINSNKIVFISTKYSVCDNPYVIYKYIKKYNSKYKLIWIVDKNADTSMLDKNEFVFTKTFKYLYTLATYKYLFTSQSYSFPINKKNGQIFIQLWHGIAIKKMGLDVNNENAMEQLEHCRDWNFVVSSSKYESDTLRSSTGYTCETKILGNARTDEIVQIKNKDKIKKELNIVGDKKIILYAPTFRDSDLVNDAISLNINNLLKNDNFIFLIRLHPFVTDKLDKSIFNSRVINADKYNVNDLLVISDILITDYSSIFFDFSLLEKPTIFYAYDYDDYIKERNGFYLDYLNDLPGPICYNEKELEKLLCTRFDIEKIKKFNEKFNKMNDGKVCKRIYSELKKGGFNK